MLTAGSGADTLRGGAGNDTLDGGAGRDTAVFSGSRAAYSVGVAGATISGPEGSDVLVNIERLQFSDDSLAFDLGAGQSAGNTIRVIGAAFDGPAIRAHKDWVGIGLQFFDSGMSMLQVCSLVADQVLRLTDNEFVRLVYTNVVGTLPDLATRDAFTSMLQNSGGSMTQGQLLEFAANCEPNAVNINLVGLQLTGVEFV